MKLGIMIASYLAILVLGYVILWGLLKLAGNERRKGILRKTILAVFVILMLFPLIGALVPDGPVCWFFQRWGNIIIGYAIYFYLTLLFIFIICLLIKLFTHKKMKDMAKCMLIIPLILSIVINIMGMHTAADVKVTNYEIPKEELNLSEPLRIVLIGDLHIGVNSGYQIYRDMVDRINEQDADLVLIAGDLVTSSFGAMKDPDKYAGIMRGIETKYGTYAVYGNHDVDEPLLGGFTYYSKEDAHRNPGMEPWVRSCGWELLEDEATEIPGIEGMVLIGRRDEAKPGDGIEERMSLTELTKGLDPDKGRLLLQHEPTDLDDLDDNGIALSLSGHTHDGQIFPGNIVTRMIGPQSYGLKSWGSSKALVTSGVGFYGPPIRVCTISEIVVIDCN